MAQPIVSKFVCLRDQVAMHIAQVMSGYICTCARADVPPPSFPHLANGWMDCTEIWQVVRDPLARRFTEVADGVRLYVPRAQCAPLFLISGTAGRIVLKLGVWFGGH